MIYYMTTKTIISSHVTAMLVAKIINRLFSLAQIACLFEYYYGCILRVDFPSLTGYQLNHAFSRQIPGYN